LTDQLRAYFDDVDRQQGAVDIDALRRSVEERVIMIELSPDKAVPPNGPTSGRRWPILAAAAAVVLVVVGALAVSGSDDTQNDHPVDPSSTVPSTTTLDTSSTELVVRPLDTPIECELELCPSLAVSPDGTLVAYDQAAKALTWYDAEPHVITVTADLDAEHVQLAAIGRRGVAYLWTGSPDTESWELVMISPSGEEARRTASSSPVIETSQLGLFERSCWSGCEPATRLLMGWENDGSPGPYLYPIVTYTTGTVTAVFGDLRWSVAWPHTLSTRSQVAPRWDGGVVLSLAPEAAGPPSELIELLPDGSVQRFDVGVDAVHVLLPDGSAVVWRDGQLVRLSPPRTPEWPTAWSPELTAQTLEPPIACTRLPWPLCPDLAVSPDGTLVALDARAETLTCTRMSHA
jgi:hypothetical protein